MGTLINIGQVLLSLSILIVLHEMGHFFPARWFKTRVEKFYLFFDFAPFNSLWKTKRGETEYGIGWLPLGGYVKISGMVDESMDTEQLKQPPQPWEFRSKKAWQRLIIMIGGVTVNFLLGIFIFAMMLWGYGKSYIPTSELQYGMAIDSVLIREGFQNGDMLLKVGNKNYERYEAGTIDIIKALVLDGVRDVTVRRNGEEVAIRLSDDIGQKLTKSNVQKKMLITPRMPFYVGDLEKGGPAQKAGLQKDDRIVSLDGQNVEFFDQFAPLAVHKKGQQVTIGVQRGTETLQLTATLTDQGKVGVYPKGLANFYKESRRKYSLAEAIPGGVREAWDFLDTQVKAFGKMFSGDIPVKDNLGSIISIGKGYGSEWVWERFWYMTATLSIILAFMNLLPIPALDGGYVMFLIWEVITGRRVSDSVMEKAVTIGFFLLLGLMIFALGLDVWRHFLQSLF